MCALQKPSGSGAAAQPKRGGGGIEMTAKRKLPTEMERKKSIVSATKGAWTEHKDPGTGAYYYFNKSTGSTQWTRPPEFTSSKKKEATEPAVGSPSPADRRAGAAASMLARVSTTRTGGGGER